MIPANITRAHLLRAIAEIDGTPIPPHQQSTRYDLVHEGKRYPPKLVVRVANRLANGEELWDFSGGPETNQFLERHGFTILLKPGNLTPQEEVTIEYNEWVLAQLLEYRKTHPEFYFLTRTNKSGDRLEAGHWFPGSDYLHVGLTRSASGDHSTKSVGLKIDCSWEGHPRAFFVVLFKQERDPAVLRFYRALLNDLAPYGMREENHDCFILPYGEDIPAALQRFLSRDVPIFQELLKKHGLEERLGVSRASFENKLNNVLRVRDASSQENPEYRLARLCWNDNGWVSPSGRGGKSPDRSAFEREHGFGFEEWLFDFDKVLDDGYHYGFLQPVNQEWQAYSGKRYNIRLYARDGESGRRCWIGELAPVEVINRQQSEAVEATYREKGWIKEMERQLADLILRRISWCFTKSKPIPRSWRESGWPSAS